VFVFQSEVIVQVPINTQCRKTGSSKGGSGMSAGIVSVTDAVSSLQLAKSYTSQSNTE